MKNNATRFVFYSVRGEPVEPPSIQQKIMRLVFIIFALSLLVSACSKSKPEPSPQKVSTPTPPAEKAPVSFDPDEEPPEAVLRELMLRQYADLEKNGGLPATITATGYSGTLHAKLYEVHKDKCVQLPADPPGVKECGVNLMVTMWWEGKPEPLEPLPDSKRISVIRDDNGVWIDCTYTMDRTSICLKGRKK